MKSSTMDTIAIRVFRYSIRGSGASFHTGQFLCPLERTRVLATLKQREFALSIGSINNTLSEGISLKQIGTVCCDHGGIVIVFRMRTISGISPFLTNGKVSNPFWIFTLLFHFMSNSLSIMP